MNKKGIAQVVDDLSNPLVISAESEIGCLFLSVPLYR